MVSDSITSWQIQGDKMKAMTDFILLGSKVTTGSNCSHEIKRRLLLGRKAMTNLDSMLKSKDITLMKKVHRQNYGFSSSQERMWELDHKEGWALRNWWLQTVGVGRLLRVPWTARRSSQSILKETGPEYSLERPMLRLKFQYFDHLVWRADSLEKTLILRKIEGKRRRGW